MSDPSSNLELKVQCGAAGLDPIVERAYSQGIGPFSRMFQTDTYFAVATGRLKLREISTGDRSSAELIAYDRPNESGPRWSSYHRVEIEPGGAPGMAAALIATCGLLAVVRKRRDVAITGRTRVHLDEVEGLGSFVELETVVANNDSDDAEAELQIVADALGLQRLTRIAGSYGDLVIHLGEKEPT